MLTFSFWHKWLVAVGLVIALFGVLMALVSGTPLFDLFNRQIDPAFWGNGAVDGTARLFQQWVYGILGATIAGWGIFLTFIARYPFAKKEKWAWGCVLAGLSVWYILDTGLSALYKVYFNVAFNTILFVLVLLPLFFTRRDFTTRS
jgi:hypothetical protein